MAISPLLALSSLGTSKGLFVVRSSFSSTFVVLLPLFTRPPLSCLHMIPLRLPQIAMFTIPSLLAPADSCDWQADVNNVSVWASACNTLYNSANYSPLTVTRTKIKALHADSGLTLNVGLVSEGNSDGASSRSFSQFFFVQVCCSLCSSEGWLEGQSADVDRGMVAFSSCGCRKD